MHALKRAETDLRKVQNKNGKEMYENKKHLRGPTMTTLSYRQVESDVALTDTSETL